MEIKRVKALSDNYIFVLYDKEQGVAAAVDPAEAAPVERLLNELNTELIAIFNTHHHHDHVGGNRQLKHRYPQAEVYGSEADRGRIPHQEVFLNEGDRVEFAGRSAEVFFVPGHTRGHIAYYFPPQAFEATGELFCGDTLFAGGCGRLFEGTPREMVSSLSKLRQLSDETRVWCAHEYTLKNLRFALTVDGDNQVLRSRFASVEAERQRDRATVPSRLGIEKQTNPFLRWEDPALQAATKSNSSLQTFTRLRGMRDVF